MFLLKSLDPRKPHEPKRHSSDVEIILSDMELSLTKKN